MIVGMGLHERITRVIGQLTTAVMNTRLYSPGHPHVLQHSTQAYNELLLLFSRKPELTLFLVGDDLIADLTKLPEKESYVKKFVGLLADKGLERVTFLAGLTQQELFRFIEQLALLDTPAIQSSAHVILGKVEIKINAPSQTQQLNAPSTGDSLSALVAGINQVRDAELGKIKHLYDQVKCFSPIDVNSLDTLIKEFISGFRRDINPIQIMASMKSADEYTFTHVVNVGLLTLSQARRIGFKGDLLHQIGIASMLHDVGKQFVPPDILNKPGLLTQKERDIMEAHTTKGAKYLMRLPGIPKIAIIASLEHHIKFDGTGYPPVEQGWQTNIVSQMITIADVFDALRSKRVYKDAKPKRVIVEILRKERGATFNPQLVDRFLEMIEA